ncbi:hypothetical protein PISMIDRAFT_36836, partial [Pisolithus microcarpus 441]
CPNNRLSVNSRSLVQDTVQREAVDVVLGNGGLKLEHGWIRIHLARTIPLPGRVSDSGDIFCSVLVEDKVHDTYQAMPSYRLCTSGGPLRLTEGL